MDTKKFKFSKKHDDSNADTIKSTIESVDSTKTFNDNKKGLDAITVLGGEAPRWVAVKDMKDNLKMTSNFYIEQPNQDAKEEKNRGVYYVSFVTLYRFWNLFDRKFNITNNEFKTKLSSPDGWLGDSRKDDKTVNDMLLSNDNKSVG
ncbi:MAG: hypothetical protein O7D86_01420 [Proteobacteria bacterium]|nr:hypothetical protein [Pseudomonadota bacterium]